MKLIDKFLRAWRVKKALQYLPSSTHAVFDIGCDDGYLLTKLKDTVSRLDGCDPRLKLARSWPYGILQEGFFPTVLFGKDPKGPYDAVFALAVFEHFNEADLRASSRQIANMLSEHGRLIVTVPHPFVDRILDLLFFLRLIDGQALEEHHGFDPESLSEILSDYLILKTKKTFQFGLNNIFIFGKKHEVN